MQAGLISDVRPRAPRKPRRRTQELHPVEPGHSNTEPVAPNPPIPLPNPITVDAPVARHTVIEEEYTW